MATWSRFSLTLAAVAAFTAVPASAQQMISVAQGGTQLAQESASSQLPDDAALLAQVLDALPEGVTLDTATDEELAAAVQSVIASYDAGSASLASGVLSVVSIALDSIGRAGVADAVIDAVVETLPLSPMQELAITANVQSARSNPSPSQLAATSEAIAQFDPGSGEGDGWNSDQFAKNEGDGLGQDVFQENPNQVSGD